MNRSFAHLALLAIVLSATLAGCRGTGSGGALDTPPYNPYIEAFTSGRVPRAATVHVVFSQMPVEAGRTAAALEKAMSLKPSTAGRWEWQDEHTAVFRPSGEFRRQTRYRVTADLGALFDAEGDDKRFSFEFETLPLALRASSPTISTPDGSEDGRYDITVEIASADSESDETVEGMVTLSEAATVQWTHGDGGTSHTMLIEDVAAGDSPRNLTVTAQGGELASVYIAARTEFGVWDAVWVSSPEKYIEVTFTKTLDAAQNLHGLAWIEGNESETITVEGNRLRLYPDNDASRTVEVHLSAAIRSATGMTLGEDTIRAVEISGEVPAFRFTGMRRKRSKFSSAVRSRQGLFFPGSVRVPRYSRTSSAVRSST